MRRQAFTLVELLIVITIITLLAGLIMSAATSMFQRAAQTKAEAQLMLVGAGIERYHTLFNIHPPMYAGAVTNFSSPPPDSTVNNYYENNYLAFYLMSDTGDGREDFLSKDIPPRQVSGQDIIDTITGEPLVYVSYTALGRPEVTVADEQECDDPREHANRSGSSFNNPISDYRQHYELWCKGADGAYEDVRKHAANADNIIAVEPYTDVGGLLVGD